MDLPNSEARSRWSTQPKLGAKGALPDWFRVREIFEAVLEVEPALRTEYLDRVCEQDLAVKQEVAKLLAVDAAAGPLTDEGEWETGSTGPILLTARAPWEGQNIGPYRVDRRIGEGGMGVVYLAHREDGEFQHRVAIKILGQGQRVDQSLQRFRAERQILAGLDHPHVARLLDGGTTLDGIPYVVLEFVEGEAIDAFCNRHRLPLESRLELFRKVLAAVHHAHRNLIVHRDLKPSNILVTEEASPKLLDFGIAKLLAPLPGELGPETTARWQRLMTPNYASPEQARGEEITTGTDIYSLGVLLYQLLCGVLPLDLAGLSAAEIERRIQELEPLPPSSRLQVEEPFLEIPSSSSPNQHRGTAINGHRSISSPEQRSAALGLRPEVLRRRLRGDLDTMVAMAMHKDPNRRYVSAAAFAEDVRRYLAGLPVQARRDTWFYRSSKFLRRNWLGVAAFLGVLALILVFAVAANRQAEWLSWQRDQLRLERDRNSEVLTFVTDLFEVASPESSRGKNLTAREILERGEERLETELRNRPEIQAPLLETIGEVNLKLGRYEVAIDLLQRSVKAQRNLEEKDAEALGESLFLLGQARLRNNEPALAKVAFREALDLARRADQPRTTLTSRNLRGLAMVAQERGRLERAQDFFGQALEIETLLGGSLELAETRLGLARTQFGLGEYDAAQQNIEAALDLERRLLEADHPRIARTLQRLAEILLHQDELVEAQRVGEEALALQEQLYGAHHPEIRLTLDSLARGAMIRRDYAAAEALLRRALDICRRAYSVDDPTVAAALNNLGHGLRAAGKVEEAEGAVREALGIYRRIWNGDHPDLASSLFNLGVLLQDQKRLQEAKALYWEALLVRRRQSPEGHTYLAFPLIRLGSLLVQEGDPEAAEPLLVEALEVRRSALPVRHRLTAAAAGALGEALTALGRFPEAEALLVEAHDVYVEIRGEDHPATQRWRRGLADLYRAWGLPDRVSESLL